MTFEDFAHGHGLILDRAIADGRWHRVPTEDKRRKRNGAYVFTGSRGAVQNWALMEHPEVWRETGSTQSGSNARAIVDSIALQEKAHRRARIEVQALLSECDRAKHPYLVRKGFSDAMGLVHPNGELLVPMRDHRNYEIINSVQHISPDGEKKNHPGGKAKGSVFKIGTRGPWWLCEGWCTALTVELAARHLRQEARILVCFSTSTMVYVAPSIPRPAFIFADNDAFDKNAQKYPGEAAAVATGMPYCMWGESGEALGDANDLMLAKGIRAVADLMRHAQDKAAGYE